MDLRACRSAAALLPLLLWTSCGGSSATAPSKTVPTGSVTATVFYDENGDGSAAGEGVRVPDVRVEVAGKTAMSVKGTGQAVVAGVPAGSYPVNVGRDTLPPFFTFSRTVTVGVPQPEGQEVGVPLTLPIGANRPNTYLAFGDSITHGDGSSDEMGYRGRLQQMLQQQLGRATIFDEGQPSSKSAHGADRIGSQLDRYRPAYVLIHYGTNDYNRQGCPPDCQTPENIRIMIRQARAAQTLPFVATIIPVNPDLSPDGRIQWVASTNERIRTVARDEGAVLVDLYAAFLKETSLPALFSDHIHPNDRGYTIMATEFFKAITGPAR
ncbi:MAG TPA: SGNH/GDSL hydrolase family protein [Vicinamibacteria bacterium]|jgi:lysophospholipase L1-like esterase